MRICIVVPRPGRQSLEIPSDKYPTAQISNTVGLKCAFDFQNYDLNDHVVIVDVELINGLFQFASQSSHNSSLAQSAALRWRVQATIPGSSLAWYRAVETPLVFQNPSARGQDNVRCAGFRFKNCGLLGGMSGWRFTAGGFGVVI